MIYQIRSQKRTETSSCHNEVSQLKLEATIKGWQEYRLPPWASPSAAVLIAAFRMVKLEFKLWQNNLQILENQEVSSKIKIAK